MLSERELEIIERYASFEPRSLSEDYIRSMLTHISEQRQEIERLSAWLPTAESAVVAEISKACNENAERAEKAEAKIADVLDQAWEAVNVLGAPDSAIFAGDVWTRGYCKAIGDALEEIEKLGGMQPEKRGKT